MLIRTTSVADCADRPPRTKNEAEALPQRDPQTQLTHLHSDATRSIVNTMPSTAKVARVAVSDEQWRSFRQAALTQGISLSTYLARLVEAELSRRRGRPVAAVDPETPPADQGLSALAEVRASIDKIAGALRCGSRCVVGGRRRLDADRARAAYQR
jgi:hypothetical protein